MHWLHQEVVYQRGLEPPTDPSLLMLADNDEAVVKWIAKANKRVHTVRAVVVGSSSGAGHSSQ